MLSGWEMVVLRVETMVGAVGQGCGCGWCTGRLMRKETRALGIHIRFSLVNLEIK